MRDAQPAGPCFTLDPRTTPPAGVAVETINRRAPAPAVAFEALAILEILFDRQEGYKTRFIGSSFTELSPALVEHLKHFKTAHGN